MNALEDAGVPEPIINAMRKFGGSVWYAHGIDGRCHLGDGFGSVGHGETWPEAYGELERSVGARRAEVARVIAREQETSARRLGNLALAAGIALAILAAAWEAVQIIRL